MLKNLPFSPAHYLADKNGKSGVNPAISFVQVPVIEKNAASTRTSISKSVANEVAVLLYDAKVKTNPKDIAILVRTHHQAGEIQQALSEKRIKSIIRSKESVYQTREASEFYHLCAAIVNPFFEGGIRAALSTELNGL